MICKIRTCARTVRLRNSRKQASRVESSQDKILVEAKVGAYWKVKTVETCKNSVKRKYAFVSSLHDGMTWGPE